MTKKRIYLCFILAAIIAIIGYLYLDNYFYRGEPPLLKEDSLITRVKPEDPGGMITDSYNSVYDQIKAGHQNTKSVTLIPEPESPLSITPQEENIDSEIDIIGNIVSGIVDEPKEQVENIEPAKSLKIINEPDEQKIKAPVKRLKTAYYVQVASTRTSAQAQKEWSKITNSHNKLLSNIDHKIEKYNIANKGSYYRLLLGPLNGSAHAKLICKKLATAKQTCIIKKI